MYDKTEHRPNHPDGGADFSPGAALSGGFGILLFFPGAYLACLSFFAVYDLLYAPEKIAAWVNLRDTIHKLPAGPVPTGEAPAPQSLNDEEAGAYIFGGYVLLIVPLVYVFLLVRISMWMLRKSGEFVFDAVKRLR